MALKIVFVLVAIAVCVHAGGPAAYSISVPSVDHASVGNTQEHTVKGHLGQSSQSDYSSQVQTAHSQSHVQRSSTSNDAGYAPHYGAGGYLGHAGYAAHGLGLAPYGGPVPALAAAHYGGPLVKAAVAAPALVHTSVAGHGLHYG